MHDGGKKEGFPFSNGKPYDIVKLIP